MGRIEVTDDVINEQLLLTIQRVFSILLSVSWLLDCSSLWHTPALGHVRHGGHHCNIGWAGGEGVSLLPGQAAGSGEVGGGHTGLAQRGYWRISLVLIHWVLHWGHCVRIWLWLTRGYIRAASERRSWWFTSRTGDSTHSSARCSNVGLGGRYLGLVTGNVGVLETDATVGATVCMGRIVSTWFIMDTSQVCINRSIVFDLHWSVS